MSMYEYQQEWKRRNAEKMRVYHKEYREAHREEFRKRDAEYYQRNKTRLDALNKKWAAEHPEQRKAHRQKYDRKIQPSRNERQRRRSMQMKQACPSWINLNHVRIVYEACPTGMEVDHIIPLKNDQVCGLHVSWNFQLLTVRENAVKNNAFDGTYNNESWRQRL